MISAKEVSELADKIASERLEKELEPIENIIINEAKLGRHLVMYDDFISKTAWLALESAGYKVEEVSVIRDGFDSKRYRISW